MINAQHSGQSVLSAAEGFIRRFCILPEPAYLPMALWTAATHIPDAFGAFPYVALLSPVKGCGKTRVLEILELLCANPQRFTSASPASIFRMMKESPTLLLDEVEALRNNKPSESAQAILSILNAGHRKGATVPRCVPPDWKVEHFPIYGPKAFAAIGRLPDTLVDRSFRIPMQRKTVAQKIERFIFAKTPGEAEPIRSAVALWAESNRDAIHQTYSSMEDLRFLADREADLWMPVFAVCAVAAPERIEELKRCALALCGDKAADDLDDSLALTLLLDVRSVWTPGRQNMTTASLMDALARLPESEWAEPEHKLTPKKLAGLLRPFGIEPRQVRVGIGTGKGYLLADFEAAYSRYLPLPGPGKETSETTRINIGGNAYFSPETQLACFGNENTLKPA
jgi:hypothetical protein